MSTSLALRIIQRDQKNSKTEEDYEKSDNEIKEVEILLGARLDHPAPATGSKEDFEVVQHDNRKNYRKFEGAAGLGLEKPRSEVEAKGEEGYSEPGSRTTESTGIHSDIGDITSTAKDCEESRSGSTRGATDIMDSTDVRDSGENCRESSKDEEILYRQIQTAPAGNEFESVSNRMFDTGEWSSERQRPTRSTKRPPRFRDKEFETQFRPEERK